MREKIEISSLKIRFKRDKGEAGLGGGLASVGEVAGAVLWWKRSWCQRWVGLAELVGVGGGVGGGLAGLVVN